MSFLLTSTVTEQDHDPILEQLQEELIEAAELGPEAVEKTLGEWCDRYPEREYAFRNRARVILLLWGLREPERLGPYQLLDVLTIGGMGKIYRAKEDVTGRVVVVKTVLAGHLSPAEQVERFDTERRLLSRLHDTHIVPLLATGHEGYLLYLVMPFIAGVTLRALIAADSAHHPMDERSPTFETLFTAASKVESNRRRAATMLPGESNFQTPPGSSEDTRLAPPGGDRQPAHHLRRVVNMMEHVAGAVQHIHDAKILHRDLKPSNIMVESSEHVWVIDIGVGREMEQSGSDPRSTEPAPVRSSCEMTRGVGTLLYMAPEQLPDHLVAADAIRPTNQDARTDVWGLGATLYELITLRPPFEGTTEAEVARKIVSEPPISPRQHQASIPREIEAICLRALAKAPDDRYARAADFAADLRRWLGGLPTVAGRANVFQRSSMWARRRPAAAFAAGMTVAFLLVASLGAVQVYQRDIERERAATTKSRLEAQALQREKDLVALQRLSNSSHVNGWFDEVRAKIRALRGTGSDPQLQAQAAASLEGIDVKFSKTIPRPFQQVAFGRRANRLLMHGQGPIAQGRPTHITALWDGATDTIMVEKDLGPGVIAFRDDGAPLQLSQDREDPAALTLYDVTTSRSLHQFRSPRQGLSAITALTLSRTGKHLAVVARPMQEEPNGTLVTDGEGSSLAVWDAGTGERVITLAHKATVDLVLSPDGRLLAAWDEAGEITVWLVPEGKPLRLFHVSRSHVKCLAFGHDPVWRERRESDLPPWLLAVGDSGGLITVWDLFANQPRSICRGSSYEINALDFSPDGAFLASAGRGVGLWSAATGSRVLEIGKLGYQVQYAITFAPDGRNLAIANGPEFLNKPSVDIVDIEQGRGIRTLYGLQGKVESVVVSPNSRLVAAVSNDWQIGIWDQPSGRLARCWRFRSASSLTASAWHSTPRGADSPARLGTRPSSGTWKSARCLVSGTCPRA